MSATHIISLSLSLSLTHLLVSYVLQDTISCKSYLKLILLQNTE